MNRHERRRQERQRGRVRFPGGAEVASIGGAYEASFRYAADPLEGKDPSKHVWVMTAAWIVQDPERYATSTADNPVLFDSENLASVSGPGCYRCMQTWEPGLENTPCPGDPDQP